MIPRRVLMTADTVGGVWTYSLELIRALEPAGIEFALATLGAPLSEDQLQEARAIPNLTSIFDSAYRLEWMGDPWADVRASGDWLLGLAASLRPDLVHLNGYAHGSLPWGRPVLIAAHSCVLSWWEAVKGEPAPRHWERYRNEISAGLSAADAIAAPSQWMLDALRSHYGVPGGWVIPNGRRPCGLSEDKAEYVLTAGRVWDEAKNLSAVGLVAQDLGWPVYVAGEDTDPEGKSRATAGGMHSLGRLNSAELALWFARAPIFAHPARYEPFGLAVLEAAQAGCALVLGDIESLRENWDGAAVFVPPDDPRELRRVLMELIRDPALRAAFQHHARERAARFTPEAMARRYVEAYSGAARAGETACAS